MLLPYLPVDAWLARRGELVTADVRWYLDGRSGREAYDAGHLPGAVFVDLDAVLAGPHGAAAGRHPLPDPEVFARGLAALGISEGDQVVAYDDAGGVVAARLVWLLRATGRDAALLDGGMAAYDGPLEQQAPSRPPGDLRPVPWPADRLAQPDDLLGPGVLVLDARDRDRFRGDHEPVDPRPGHVPGARNLPARELVGLSPEQLRLRFAEVGVAPGSDVIASCGSGVTACADLLALEQAGLGRGRLYPGSWSQWSADPSRPAATGD